VVGVINPGQKFSVAIEAHADEISWFVKYITDDGLIYVARNGGSDHQIAPSKRVNIHVRKTGKIEKAVFGWPAIHTRGRDGKEEAPTMKNICLDCGCFNKKEVEAKGIRVGDVITYEDELMVMNEKLYVGRALDNRMGGFMIAETARLLKENKIKLPYTLYVINAVQEEVGLNGASMIASRLKPNCAIITDVCHDTTTPMISKIVEGEVKLGKGPVLSVAPAVHNNLLDLMIEVSDKNKIPYQMEALSRSTGTDTDGFAFSGQGIPSSLISLPLRYMHTTVETAHHDDIENCIRMFYATLLALKPNFNFKYL
jgi:putative aminopeptidase FrvX